MIISAPKWQSELTGLSAQLLNTDQMTKDGFDAFKFERAIYYIAICIRKLHDTPLRPRKLDFYSWSLSGDYYDRIQNSRKNPWWFAVESNFDMTRPHPANESLKRVIDMVIHSRVLDYSFSKNSIIIGSDRNDKVFGISRDQFCNYCIDIANADFLLAPGADS